MKLSKLAKIAINGDKEIRNFIMGHYGISRQTLHIWRAYHDKRLLDEKVINFIAKTTGANVEQLIAE